MRRKKIMKVYEIHTTSVPNTLKSQIVCLRCLRTGKRLMSCRMFLVKQLSSLSNSGTVVLHSVVI
jgi:hypothetical protein